MQEAYAKAVQKGIPKRATSWDCKGYSIIFESYDAFQKNLPILDFKFVYDVDEEYLYYVHEVIDVRSGKVKSTKPMRIGKLEAAESVAVDPENLDLKTTIDRINQNEGIDVIQYFIENYDDVTIRFINRGLGDLVVDFTDPSSGLTAKYRIGEATETIDQFENTALS